MANSNRAPYQVAFLGNIFKLLPDSFYAIYPLLMRHNRFYPAKRFNPL